MNRLYKDDFSLFIISFFPGASSSKDYTYIEHEQKFIEHIQNENKDDSFEYLQSEDHEEEIIRYPVTDPKKPFVCQHCGVGR